MPKVQDWEGTTGGGEFGQKVLFRFLSRVNVVCIYPILYIVIPFYMLFRRKEYHSIYYYFHNILKKSRFQSWRLSFRNFLNFGEVVVDKFAILAGNTSQFEVETIGKEYFDNLLDEPKGIIVVGAHIGNFEYIAHCFSTDKKKINTVLFDGETVEYAKNRDNYFTQHNINLVQVKQNDMSHVFAITHALENNEIVCVACDRMNGSSKHFTEQFFGREIAIPVGFFKMAQMLETEIVAMFVMKASKKKYRTYIFPLAVNEQLNAGQIAKNYVNRMEEMVTKYPTQWFNFFPYWN